MEIGKHNATWQVKYLRTNMFAVGPAFRAPVTMKANLDRIRKWVIYHPKKHALSERV